VTEAYHSDTKPAGWYWARVPGYVPWQPVEIRQDGHAYIDGYPLRVHIGPKGRIQWEIGPRIEPPAQ